MSAENFQGRSLTAITIAAHEVGHALQHASGYPPLMWRTRLVRWVSPRTIKETFVPPTQFGYPFMRPDS